MSTGHWLDAFRLFVSLSLGMIYVVVLCLFGDDMTYAFDEIYHEIDATSYYELPVEMQKYIPMMMAIGQKSMHMKGHMNLKCNRPFLKQVQIISLFFN